MWKRYSALPLHKIKDNENRRQEWKSIGIRTWKGGLELGCGEDDGKIELQQE